MCRPVNIAGISKELNNGMQATCIADKGSGNIDIIFEDGTIKRNVSRYNFMRGSVAHPKILTRSLVGRYNYMNNGMKATCINDRGYNDIDIQFEDGVVREHVSREFFRRGYLSHPYYNVKSQPQTVIFNTIRMFFPDAIMDYRPDWLKNNYTGRNFELDIYIPSKKVAIEYDGAVGHHLERTKGDTLKYMLIDETIQIERLFNVREQGTISHEKYEKVVDYTLDCDYSDKDALYFQLGFICSSILHMIGVNKQIKFDKAYINKILKPML